MSAAHTTSLLGRVRVSARSDEALLERARTGDEASFEELHRRNRDAVLGYCLLRLQDRSAAEEATQDVFLKAHLSSGEPVKNVKAWLFTVAHNAVIDTSRRMRAVPVGSDLETVIDSMPSADDDSVFEALDVTSNVFIALRRLPARDRKAIILREFQDKSSQQIADEMDVSPGAVDVLLCRARAAFGRAYAEVSDMPHACRQTTELIYRDMGSGITGDQRQMMESHIGTCPRCSTEMKRAHSPRSLGGFLPWPWLQLGSLSLAKPMIRTRSLLSTMGTNIDRYFMSSWTGPAKATVAAAIVVAAVTPVAMTHVPGSPFDTMTRPASSASHQGSGWNNSGSTWNPGPQMRGAWSGSSFGDPGWSMNSRYGEFAPHTWMSGSWSSMQGSWPKGKMMSGSTRKWSSHSSSSGSWSSGSRHMSGSSAGPSSGSWSGSGSSSGSGSRAMGGSGSWSAGSSGSGGMTGGW